MAPLALPPRLPHLRPPLPLHRTHLHLRLPQRKRDVSTPTSRRPSYNLRTHLLSCLWLHRRISPTQSTARGGGAQGERLAPEPEKEGDDTVLDGLIAETEGRGRKRKAGGRDGERGDAAVGAGAGDGTDGVEGWQDPEEYRRETEQDGIQQGEIGDRNNFISNDGDPSIRATALQGVDGEAAGKKVGKVDKEARKKAKKERAKAENKERAAKRVKDKA